MSFPSTLSPMELTLKHWLLVRLSHSHEGLKTAAQVEGLGTQANLRTASKIVDVDPHKPTVTMGVTRLLSAASCSEQTLCTR